MVSVKITGINGVKNISIYEYLALYASQAEREITNLETKLEISTKENTLLQEENEELKQELKKYKDFEVKED